MKLLTTISVFFLCVTVFSQTDSTVKKVQFPAGYVAKLDEVYSTINDWQGREDIYYNPTATKPTPVIFNIHGGGWQNGKKETQGGFNPFFAAGFAVVNIEYRLSGQATAPAAVEDVRAAILNVVKKSKELNIDPHNIVVMGGSAGGHLALMAGLLQNDNQFDGEYKKVKKYTIKAIIDKYGITDVGEWAYSKTFRTSGSATKWLGAKAKDSLFANTVSPIYYVKKTSPAVFIVHGDADPTVPYQQSINIKKRLDEEGVKNEMMTIEGGDHGKNFTKEQKAEIYIRVLRFLKELNVIDK